MGIYGVKQGFKRRMDQRTWKLILGLAFGARSRFWNWEGTYRALGRGCVDLRRIT